MIYYNPLNQLYLPKSVFKRLTKFCCCIDAQSKYILNNNYTSSFILFSFIDSIVSKIVNKCVSTYRISHELWKIEQFQNHCINFWHAFLFLLEGKFQKRVWQIVQARNSILLKVFYWIYILYGFLRFQYSYFPFLYAKTGSFLNQKPIVQLIPLFWFVLIVPLFFKFMSLPLPWINRMFNLPRAFVVPVAIARVLSSFVLFRLPLSSSVVHSFVRNLPI